MNKQTNKVVPASNSMPYLFGVVIMAAITLIAIAVIAVVRPSEDNIELYVLISGFSTTTTAALLAFMKAQETHLSVNSRLEEFIRNADRAARSEGELAGRAAGRELADQRADQLKAEE